MVTFRADRVRKASLFALMLVATAAGAQVRPEKQLVVRSLFLSKDSRDEAPEVFVSGRTVTTLRFEKPCDPVRTKLLGWEGRFEPLLVGDKLVVIAPSRDLTMTDRFFLLVTLQDGTELPFSLANSRTAVDVQVNVFPDWDSPGAMRFALEEERAENESLRAENQRYREEETSVEHALAALLVNNRLAMTPFQETQKWRLREPGIEVEVRLLMTKGATRGKGQAAVVFRVTNRDPERPWRLQEARLTSATNSQEKPFALRMTPSSIAPGESGQLAVVTDLASFDASPSGSDKLVLEIFRDGGLRQGYVVLCLPDGR